MNRPGTPDWDFDKEIPPGHPIRKFCSDWAIDSNNMREALCELILDLVIQATLALMDDDDDFDE